MREQAELGEYFAFDSHLPDEIPGHPWLPLRLSEATVSARIEQVRVALTVAMNLPDGAPAPSAAVQARVAASVAQLGITARLLSPVLGMAVVSSRVLELSDPRWQPTPGGAFALSIRADCPSSAEPSPDRALVDNLVQILAAGPIRELLELTVARSVAPIIAWGNVASAMNGAASMLARVRPDLAERAIAISHAVLTSSASGLPMLAKSWAGTPTHDFRRRSCCLIYLLAPPGTPDERPTCQDCVLAPVGSFGGFAAR